MSPHSHRPRVLAAALLVTVGVGACGGSEQSPAEARRDRVEARLRTSFSAAQARCILDRADPDLLQALDRRRDLDPDAPALADWSGVLVACVTGTEVTTTTR